MLQHPLTISLGEEEDDISLRLFYTIQLHAGSDLTYTHTHILLSTYISLLSC